MAEWLDDFFLARSHPNAFNWQKMPADWREMQRFLARRHERFQVVLAEESTQLLMSLFGKKS